MLVLNKKLLSIRLFMQHAPSTSSKDKKENEMAKITRFMRVTKQPKAHDKKVTALTSGKSVVEQKNVLRDDGEAVGRDEDESPRHIPTFVYETVKYKHKGESRAVSKELTRVVEYINSVYVVPQEFEQDAKFGCYSGLTYEKRVARAYTLGQLSCKIKGKDAPKPICLTCARVGHTYKQCPDGF
ncbi:hypothetical protein PsorP6_016892 [Peronosclerospora sorghi]|uniref:Uncharacterized protein n=1 Tax=Peronosclerospora sorghi TaxID=230839 RepID=A0ACC0WBH6_9STRA|nr:hypothetical protein PsorP6_016892 [Peronosclerospora sorghi]